MNIDELKEKCNCCISGKPLKTSKYMNWINLDRKATWRFPVWGNVITGEKSMACAYVHDDCMDQNGGGTIGEILYAVEVKGNEIIYHPVKDLVEHVPVCPDVVFSNTWDDTRLNQEIERLRKFNDSFREFLEE